MDEKLENFLLYGISDDWAAIGEFHGTAEKLDRVNFSRQRVLEIVEELAEAGLIRLGAFPGNGRSWEPWDASIDEAIHRIAYGYNGQRGYLSIADEEIGSNEVFRAEITDAGVRRLRELGDPYEKYGDPWSDDPFLRA
ncbi:hypothetical protein GV792_17320 [Nocardia cyriacigeorgica]|uniref:Uncharacterized protein n=1 Tax=Nocardia cyriacigeorgica TaxID=135487 RepID=A0A6P1DES1_9NOCA|nr:hypothetical protein [Nocardia cyriacigeorgica]NEW40203.1 hypothetical protein [Nocardia cyriacigeorgica]NEW47260.1 hypothetical protein [Nocardia cyriacigeorgica]NEW51804.1 hypothetical protein [Nocardia cyriacigeorgica]